MGTPTFARLLDSNDRKAVPSRRHVERCQGPDRATAASRRDARHGSRPPTGVGAVVREGVTKLVPGGTMHPARTLSTLPTPQPPHAGRAGWTRSPGHPARLHGVADLTAVEARVLSAVDEAWAVSRLRDLVA